MLESCNPLIIINSAPRALRGRSHGPGDAPSPGSAGRARATCEICARTRPRAGLTAPNPDPNGVRTIPEGAQALQNPSLAGCPADQILANLRRRALGPGRPRADRDHHRLSPRCDPRHLLAARRQKIAANCYPSMATNLDHLVSKRSGPTAKKWTPKVNRKSVNSKEKQGATRRKSKGSSKG